MDTVGDQARCTTVTEGQQRKIERDKTRARRGNVQRKRLHVLRNPLKLAFRGWEEVPEPWTYADCEEYIEWCHIDKKFPPERHRKNRKSNKANLRFCLCPDFTQRCVEVYQVLYGQARVERNEVMLYICRMVWAELVLKKTVDWCTIKQAKNIMIPEEQDIPRGVLRFLHGGLNLLRPPVGQDAEEDDTEASEEDNNSDGTRTNRAHVAPGCKRALKALREQKRARREDGSSVAIVHVACEVPSTVATSTTGLGTPESIPAIQAPIIDPSTATPSMPCSASREDLKSQLEAKEVVIAGLQDDIQKLLLETKENRLVIAKQVQEIEELCRQ
jgi:hypothetical protein